MLFRSYSLLGVLWLFLLDRKIKHGPEPPEAMARRAGRGFLETAGRRPAHGEGMADVADGPSTGTAR